MYEGAFLRPSINSTARRFYDSLNSARGIGFKDVVGLIFLAARLETRYNFLTFIIKYK